MTSIIIIIKIMIRINLRYYIIVDPVGCWLVMVLMIIRLIKLGDLILIY